MSTPALKEWSAAVHALLDGRQTVLLRKGGIHEKRFDLTANEFVFFPTVAHEHAERVRPEHRDLRDPAGSVRSDRLDFRPRHRLTVLVVQTRPLAEPLRLPGDPAYAGCKSWVDLPVSPEWAEPVHDDATLALIAARVTASVG